MNNLRFRKGQSKNSEGFFYRLLAVPELGVIVALISCAAIFQSFNSVFLSFEVMGSVVQAVTFVSIIAVGQAFLLISGVFDLSIAVCPALSAQLYLAVGDVAYFAQRGNGTWFCCQPAQFTGLCAATDAGITVPVADVFTSISRGVRHAGTARF